MVELKLGTGSRDAVMKLRFSFWSVALLVLAVSAVSADTLRLRDGRTIEGDFVDGSPRRVRFMGKDGVLKVYSITEIRSIVFGEAPAPTAGRPGARRRSSVVLRPSPPIPRQPSAATAPSASEAVSVPVGTVITVRMIDSIDSDVTRVGEKFLASLDDPLVVDERIVVERGADVTVQVVRVEQSGKFAGRDEVALKLSDITIDGEKYAVVSNYAEVASGSRGKRTAKVVGGTTALGAIIGAIAGGGKGAAIGATAGAGAGAAVQAATRGQRVQIPSESRLDFKLTQPLPVK